MKLFQSPESKVFAGLFLIMLILYIVRPDSGEKRAIKERDKNYARSLDSLASLHTKATMEIQRLELKAEQDSLATVEARKERDIAKEETKIARKKYENIRIRMHTDAQYDSVLSALFPSR